MSEIFIFTGTMTKRLDTEVYTVCIIAESKNAAIGEGVERLSEKFPGYSLQGYWCEQLGDSLMIAAGWTKER